MNLKEWHEMIKKDLEDIYAGRLDDGFYTNPKPMEKFWVATKYSKIEVILPQEQFKDIMNNPNMNFVVINHIP